MTVRYPGSGRTRVFQIGYPIVSALSIRSRAGFFREAIIFNRAWATSYFLNQPRQLRAAVMPKGDLAHTVRPAPRVQLQARLTCSIPAANLAAVARENNRGPASLIEEPTR